MNAMEDFVSLFGRAPTVTTDAPGRVNLIGEHTDYNGGFVLPIAIPQRTRVELARRDDRMVRVASAEVAGGVRTYRLDDERRAGDWLDYVRGCTAVLAADGHRIGGFDARIASDVPIGSGVSSSAALEVAMLRALRAAFDLSLDDVAIARLGQRVENEFVGARVGLMDQMAASLADEHTALFIDMRTVTYERVPLPAHAAIAAVDSGIAHAHATGAYNTRREECEEAARRLGVAELRDVGVDDAARIASLPPPLDRLARHVVTENARVLAAVAALRADAPAEVGRLMNASHASLRDDYEVSIPAIDLLVAIAQEQAGVWGARMTGGGFGGAIVMLTERRAAAEIAARVAGRYRERSGEQASVLVPAPAESQTRSSA